MQMQVPFLCLVFYSPAQDETDISYGVCTCSVFVLQSSFFVQVAWFARTALVNGGYRRLETGREIMYRGVYILPRSWWVDWTDLKIPSPQPSSRARMFCENANYVNICIRGWPCSRRAIALQHAASQTWILSLCLFWSPTCMTWVRNVYF